MLAEHLVCRWGELGLGSPDGSLGSLSLQDGHPLCQASVSPECTLAREGNAEKAEVLLPSEFICLMFCREVVGV